MSAQVQDLTPIKGVTYYYPPLDAVLVFKDGAAEIPYGGLPVPLLEEDYASLDGEPSYDAVGRGVYQALRTNPDCIHCAAYATLLRDAYPHYLAELASHAIMLDGKDVEVPYIDRKIASLKVLSLLEPGNGGLPLEIGRAYLDRGLRLSALHMSTVSIYRAEHFLRRALELKPGDGRALRLLGEVCYLLGKYEEAASCWRDTLDPADADEAERFRVRLARISEGRLPLIAPVDYLEAIGAAFACFHAGGYEEAVAILQDVLMDGIFCAEFPIADIHCVIGKSFMHLDMPRYAEESFRAALQLDPAHEESLACLRKATGEE